MTYSILFRPHPPVKSQSKVFDLPKFAPTARIIRLSSSFRRKTHKKSDDSSLFRDAAGPFDNFEAFDLTSSGEANSPRKKSMSGRQSRKPGNIDDFFPMSS
ncbi:hypothetical protein DICVIV_08637 [Dictyocaulus viviparus]|uniref:Uncharacterized protein n=1 Tax=Dictyocaulus viviparus TaxID=29172 RepID=A0A0D8XLB7_DICVI|nr:hypothetical protein DICVIV_08637 [Dictyocaulus viviparus]